MTSLKTARELIAKSKAATEKPWYLDENHISSDQDIVCDYITELKDRDLIASMRNEIEQLAQSYIQAVEVIKKLEKYVAHNGDDWVKTNAQEFLRKIGEVK